LFFHYIFSIIKRFGSKGNSFVLELGNNSPFGVGFLMLEFKYPKYRKKVFYDNLQELANTCLNKAYHNYIKEAGVAASHQPNTYKQNYNDDHNSNLMRQSNSRYNYSLIEQNNPSEQKYATNNLQQANNRQTIQQYNTPRPTKQYNDKNIPPQQKMYNYNDKSQNYMQPQSFNGTIPLRNNNSRATNLGNEYEINTFQATPVKMENQNENRLKQQTLSMQNNMPINDNNMQIPIKFQNSNINEDYSNTLKLQERFETPINIQNQNIITEQTLDTQNNMYMNDTIQIPIKFQKSNINEDYSNNLQLQERFETNYYQEENNLYNNYNVGKKKLILKANTPGIMGYNRETERSDSEASSLGGFDNQNYRPQYMNRGNTEKQVSEF
jgi:hypothetical protein